MSSNVSTPDGGEGQAPPPPTLFSLDPELAPGYYLQLRSDFLRSPDFSPTAKVLYSLLLYYASVGNGYWPRYEILAEECAVPIEDVQEALSTLVAAGLLTHVEAATDGRNMYCVHTLPTSLSVQRQEQEMGTSTCRTKGDGQHIPLEQANLRNKRIQEDTALLVEKVGISKAAARRLAQLVAERGCSVGYVAEVVEYALTTPGIKNPAGCVVELIRRKESRKPSNTLSHQDGAQALDAEKYTTGKYAFLFRRHAGQENTADDAGDEEGSDGQHKQDGQSGEQHPRETQEERGEQVTEGEEL